MNKLFSKIAGLSIGLAMAIGVGVAVGSNEAKSVSAATGLTQPVSYSDFSGGTQGTGISISATCGAFTVELSKGYKNTSYTHNYANGVITFTGDASVSKITGIVITASSSSYNGAQSSGSWSVESGGGDVSYSGTTITYSSGTASTVALKHTKQLRWTAMTITYDTASTTEATGISFSPSSVTVSGGLSGSFTPTLTGGSGNYEKTISWSSSNTTILPNPSNSEDGEVVNFTTTNPASNTTVTLTASVVSPGKSNIGSITITVNHVAEHTITYDANGGTGSMEDSINVVSANEFTAPSGMEFKEWNTSDDGKGTSYEPGDIVSDDTDLYAIWQRLRYTTGFESSDGFTATQTYNTTKVDGPAGKQWQFVNGTAASGNVITGEQSAQMRKYKDTSGNPNINMQFNIDEIHSISFNAKAGNASMGVEVFYSTNNGSSWTSIGTETVGTSVVAVEKEISSYVASGRFKIEYTGDNPSSSNRWMSIDDIVIETQSATPTVTSVSLSPSDDITLKVGNSETYEVTISGTNLLGTETVDVVLTDDLGDYVSVDTDSGLKNGDTFTVTASDAGGIGELYVSYNSGAVDSDHIIVVTEEAKTMSSISVHASGTTSYFTGDVFSTTGFEIYASYTDSTSEDVTSNSVFELMRSGSPVSISTTLLSTDTTVRVSYTESGATKTVNITIEVIDDYVETLSWGSRGTVDCFEGTTLGSAVSTDSWTFTANWASGATTYPTFGTGNGQVHIGLYSTSAPESETTALSTSYAFTKNDNDKYLVAYFGGAFTAANTNRKVAITDLLNAINVDTPASFGVASSISVGDVVYLAAGETYNRELNGTSTSSTKYGIATAYTDEPAKLDPLTVCEGNSSGTFAFKDSDDKYLYWGSGNSLNRNAELSDNTSWTVTFSSGNASIVSAVDNTRSIRYNANSGQERFACYLNGGQQNVQLWKNIPAGEKNIANTDLTVQKVVVSFAKTMNSIMNDTNVCSGDYSQRSTAWGLVADEYDDLFGAETSLDSDQLALAKQMLGNVDATIGWDSESNRDVLQQAMKTYDVCVNTYKLTAFMSGVRSAKSLNVNLLQTSAKSAGTTIAIIAISAVSLAAIGGYFLFRKRKEQ